MTHQDEFLSDTLQFLRGLLALRIAHTPVVEHVQLLLSTAKEEESALGVAFCQLTDHLFHQFQRVDLPFMGCKGCNTDPCLLRIFHLEGFRQL